MFGKPEALIKLSKLKINSHVLQHHVTECVFNYITKQRNSYVFGYNALTVLASETWSQQLQENMLSVIALNACSFNSVITSNYNLFKKFAQ